jgi:hypothetical protein
MLLKNFTKFDKRLLGLAIILLIIFSYLLYDDSLIMNLTTKKGQKIASINQTKSDVRQKYSSDFKWNSTSSGKSIHVGDSIFTGPGSTVKIKLNDNSEVELAENSMVTFTQVNGQLSLVLKSGQIKGDTKNIKDETADVASQLKKMAQSDKIAIPKPSILTPAPYVRRVIQINPDGTLAEPPSVDVSWLFEKPDTKFEVQFAKDSKFESTEFLEVVDRKTFISPELKEGPHFIRVRELDPVNPNTKWSKLAQVEFVFERPKRTKEFPAPQLSRPDIKYIIGTKAPLKLEWKPVGNAASYLLELDTTGQFKDPKKQILSDSFWKIDEVEPGQYLYRVTALNTERQMGPTSQIGRARAIINPVVLNEISAQTYFAKSKIDKLPPTQFTAEWNAAPLADKYYIQVATEAEFKKPIQLETTATQITIPVKKEGIYFLRVQALRRKNEVLNTYSATTTLKYYFEKPLDTPIQVAPFNNLTLFFQTKKETPFWFEWKPVPMAQEYNIEVSQDINFNNIVFSKKTPTVKYLIQDPLPLGNLFWRVRAAGNNRQSEWSAIRQIKVLSGRAPARER